MPENSATPSPQIFEPKPWDKLLNFTVTSCPAKLPETSKRLYVGSSLPQSLPSFSLDECCNKKLHDTYSSFKLSSQMGRRYSIVKFGAECLGSPDKIMRLLLVQRTRNRRKRKAQHLGLVQSN